MGICIESSGVSVSSCGSGTNEWEGWGTNEGLRGEKCAEGKGDRLLRIQVSVKIPILLSFYSSQFILHIFHSFEHLQLAGVCCDCCDCIF